MSSMMDRLDEDRAESWKPQAGEKLAGTIVEIGKHEAGWGPYRIIVVRREDGSRAAFHAFHTVAKYQLEDQYPSVGDEIGIKYEGKLANKDGTGTYHSYRIIVEHPAGWSPPSLEDAAGQQDRETSPPPSPVIDDEPPF